MRAPPRAAAASNLLLDTLIRWHIVISVHRSRGDAVSTALKPSEARFNCDLVKRAHQELTLAVHRECVQAQGFGKRKGAVGMIVETEEVQDRSTRRSS